MHLPGSQQVRLVGKGSLNKSLKGSYQRGQSQHKTTEDEVTKEEDDARRSAVFSELPVNVTSNTLTDETGSFDTTLHGQPRLDKSGNTRNKQRARKLDLKTIDWYDKRSTSTPSEPPPAQTSLDDYVVDKSKQGNARRDTARGGVRGGRVHKTPG